MSVGGLCLQEAHMEKPGRRVKSCTMGVGPAAVKMANAETFPNIHLFTISPSSYESMSKHELTSTPSYDPIPHNAWQRLGRDWGLFDFRVSRGEHEMLSMPKAQVLYFSSAYRWLSCFCLFIKSCYNLQWRGASVKSIQWRYALSWNPKKWEQEHSG